MKRKPTKSGPRFAVGLTASNRGALRALALKDDVSVSRPVRCAIARYLDNHRQTAEPASPFRVFRRAEGSACQADRIVIDEGEVR